MRCELLAVTRLAAKRAERSSGGSWTLYLSGQTKTHQKSRTRLALASDRAFASEEVL